MRPMRRALAVGVAAFLLAACGGESGQATSKAAWTARHGDALGTLNKDLEAARATLSSLQRPNILGTCTQLRDSEQEVRKGLPVPNGAADAALRTALDAIAEGVEDCVRGAQGPNIPQLERSFGELREAQTLMVVANSTIENWS